LIDVALAEGLALDGVGVCLKKLLYFIKRK